MVDMCDMAKWNGIVPRIVREVPSCRQKDQATFILSLDCEGKWGVADQLSERHEAYLTTKQLTHAYHTLLRVLARRKIKATFAFVGAFTMSADEYHSHPELFGSSPLAKAWLRHFKTDMRSGNSQGWFAPAIFDAVRVDGRHEIASH